MSAHSQSNRSWRAARSIRRISGLATHEMATIDPRWPLFESAGMDLDATDLRPLLDVMRVCVVPAALATSRAGHLSMARMVSAMRPCDGASAGARWVSLGRNVSSECAGRLVELARHWPVQ